MLNLAVRWGLADANPVREVKFLREEKRPDRILSRVEEEERLLAACDRTRAPHVRPIADNGTDATGSFKHSHDGPVCALVAGSQTRCGEAAGGGFGAEY